MSAVDKYVADFDRKVLSESLESVVDELIENVALNEAVEDELSAAFDELVEHAVTLRDRGEPREAQKALKKLWSKHKTRSLCLEILVLDVLFLQDATSFSDFSLEIPDVYKQDKHISLLRAGGHFRKHEYTQFFDLISSITPEDVIDIPSFNQFRDDVISAFVDQVAGLTWKASVLTKSPGMAELHREAEVHAGVQKLIPIRDVNDFESFLIARLFISLRQSLFAHNLMGPISNEFARSRPGDERCAVLLRLLVGLQVAEQAAQLAGEIETTPISNNPDFIKQLFKLSDLDGMADWKRKAVVYAQSAVAYPSLEPWTYRKAVVQSHELRGRILTIRNASDDAYKAAMVLPRTHLERPNNDETSPHLFVGIFGQCRFPSYVFPRLQSILEGQFSQLANEGWAVSTGIATWNLVGSRGLFDTDSLHFLQERLPQEIGEELANLQCDSVAQARKLLPETVGFCTGIGSHSTELTTDYLKEKLFSELHVDISTDAKFMDATGDSVLRSLSGDSHMLNQARMWDRLHALNQLANLAEENQNRPASRYMLIRADLIFTEPNFIRNLITKSSGFQSNFVLADHDAHANFIEGLGDRIIYCDRQAFARIVDGKRLFTQVVSDNALREVYSPRCHAHQFLETILFEHDARIGRIPWQDLTQEIYRGRASMQDIMQHLSKDCQSDDPKLDGFRMLLKESTLPSIR